MPPQPVTACNLSGNWILDEQASDSLDPLFAYHGGALTPAAALSTTLPPPLETTSTATSASAVSAAAAAEVDESQRSPASVLLGQESFAPTAVHTLAAVTEGENEERSRANSLLPAETTPGEEQPEGEQEQDEKEKTTMVNTVQPSTGKEGGEDAQAEQSQETDSAAAPAPSAATPPPPPPPSIPALIIHHSKTRFLSYMHGLIPHRDPVTHKLLRYDPDPRYTAEGGKLSLFESYKLDGAYHTLTSTSHQTKLSVSARAYPSPHGRSIVVDTRCGSAWDLERTERFLDAEGKKLIVEIRILSARPQPQEEERKAATAAGKQVGKGKKVSTPSRSSQQGRTPSTPGAPPAVREVLFIRRVFNKIIDADPKAAAAAAAAAAVATSTTTATTGPIASPTAASVGAVSVTSTPAASAQLPLPSPTAQPDATVAASAATGTVPSQLNFEAEANRQPEQIGGKAEPAEAHVPMQLTPALSALLSPAALPSAAPAATPSSATSSPLNSLLYPRTSLLPRYSLSSLLSAASPSASASAPSPSFALAATASAENKLFQRARKQMQQADNIIVGVLMAFLLYFLLWQGGVSSSGSAAASASASAAAAATSEALIVAPHTEVVPVASAAVPAPL